MLVNKKNCWVMTTVTVTHSETTPTRGTSKRRATVLWSWYFNCFEQRCTISILNLALLTHGISILSAYTHTQPGTTLKSAHAGGGDWPHNPVGSCLYFFWFSLVELGMCIGTTTRTNGSMESRSYKRRCVWMNLLSVNLNLPNIV